MTNEFRELLLTLDQSIVTVCENHFLKIESDKSEDLFNEILTRSKYIGRRLVKKEAKYFILSVNPSHWSEIPPIYLTVEDWWNRHKNASRLPEEYFIVDENISSEAAVIEPFIASAKAFFDFSALLRSLSEGCITSDNKAILVASGEGEFKKKNVSLASTLADVKSASNEMDYSNDTAHDLLELIELQDPHQPERKNVLIRTILEVLSEPNPKSDVAWLVVNSGRIEEKYREQYQLYVHNFSVSRLLNEIDQKSLEFNSKLMDFISSSQNKALTIPGALIAVGALIKSKGIAELLLIVFGVWAVYRIVTTSNSIMRKTFSDLEWQIKNSFSKYSGLSDDHAVSTSATENSEKLYEKIREAKSRLGQVDILAKFTFIASIIYCLLASVDPFFSENPSLMRELSNFSDFVVFKADQTITYFYGLAQRYGCELQTSGPDSAL